MVTKKIDAKNQFYFFPPIQHRNHVISTRKQHQKLLHIVHISSTPTLQNLLSVWKAWPISLQPPFKTRQAKAGASSPPPHPNITLVSLELHPHWELGCSTVHDAEVSSIRGSEHMLEILPSKGHSSHWAGVRGVGSLGVLHLCEQNWPPKNRAWRRQEKLASVGAAGAATSTQANPTFRFFTFSLNRSGLHWCDSRLKQN